MEMDAKKPKRANEAAMAAEEKPVAPERWLRADENANAAVGGGGALVGLVISAVVIQSVVTDTGVAAALTPLQELIAGFLGVGILAAGLYQAFKTPRRA